MTQFDPDHDKRKKVIMDYLRANGYPNLHPQQIVDALPLLWRELDKAQLIPPGVNYDAFCKIAVHQYNEEFKHAQLDRMMGIFGKKVKDV